jgi:aryl-alcohol dehydrogenase-like predicted oxidoreductase
LEVVLPNALSLDRYRVLGRSGLRISPLALGTMTFGSDWGWGTDKDEAREIFNTYLERGGNFIDTANIYTNGASEEFIGSFAGSRRNQLVIATKYTLATRTNDPNSGGNHRKSLVQSVETSLRRLMTDHIDLLYLHAWDSATPVEEVLRAMDDLVRSGKVLYLGISNTPAWQVSRMQAIADLRAWSPLIALQIEFNLIERTPERELIPMALEMGLGVVPWAPLASGLLADKYSKADLDPPGSVGAVKEARKRGLIERGELSLRSLAVVDVVKSVALELGKTPAQVSLAWLLAHPAVTCPIVGARTLAQLHDNLGALDVQLSAAQLAELFEASAIRLGFPHDHLAWLATTPFLSTHSRGSK